MNDSARNKNDVIIIILYFKKNKYISIYMNITTLLHLMSLFNNYQVNYNIIYCINQTILILVHLHSCEN